VVVQRTGYSIGAVNINKGKCRFCQEPIAGVWGV
jgi:hypothetical protein